MCLHRPSPLKIIFNSITFLNPRPLNPIWTLFNKKKETSFSFFFTYIDWKVFHLYKFCSQSTIFLNLHKFPEKDFDRSRVKATTDTDTDTLQHMKEIRLPDCRYCESFRLFIQLQIKQNKAKKEDPTRSNLCKKQKIQTVCVNAFGIGRRFLLKTK